jgi:hypothetical protein
MRPTKMLTTKLVFCFSSHCGPALHVLDSKAVAMFFSRFPASAQSNTILLSQGVEHLI